MNDCVVITDLTHIYPSTRKQRHPRTALSSLTLAVGTGELFSILGPNGSGKSTLFKILSTLIRPTGGSVQIMGSDLHSEAVKIRRHLGIAFQSPSLDDKLTVAENLIHQGHLYFLRGDALERRIDETLTLVGLADRKEERVERLSGGMKRRVELAKCLLHRPSVLLLDEPSTGLDPGARKEFMNHLGHLRSTEGVTILLTTHILDEADKCDRIAILDDGRIVALGTPAELKNEIGGDVITLTSGSAAQLAEALSKESAGAIQMIGNTIRIERPQAHSFVPYLFDTFPGKIESVTLSKPTLEDVFIHRTGHRFWVDSSTATDA